MSIRFYEWFMRHVMRRPYSGRVEWGPDGQPVWYPERKGKR